LRKIEKTQVGMERKLFKENFNDYILDTEMKILQFLYHAKEIRNE